MAPTTTTTSSSRRRSKTTRKASKPRNHHKKKQLVKRKMVEFEFDIEGSSVNDDNNIISTTASASPSPCSTPKAERFRIQEIKTCPPPPKKQRVLSNCLLQRTPIAFFAPPDLELFFFFALRDVSV